MKKICTLLFLIISVGSFAQVYDVKSTSPLVVVRDVYARHPVNYSKALFFATDSLKWYYCNGANIYPLTYGGGGAIPYVAGTGISISNNTISGNYTAGSGVSISGNTISATASAYAAGTGLTLNSNTFSINLAPGNGISINSNTISGSYVSGTGISISGNTITNSSPGAVYEAGTGLSLISGTFANTAPDQVISMANGTGISVTGTYPTFTITNTQPDETVTLSNGTGISVSGTYPAFTITNTQPGTTYAAGTGLTLNSNTFSTSLAAGNGISIDGNTITNSSPGATYAAGTGLTLNSNTFSTNLAAGTGITINSNTISANYTAGTGISISGNTITNSSPGTTYAAGTGITLSTNTFSINLIAGSGITISSNTISATAAGYAAGTGLTLSSNTFTAQSTVALWNANQLQGLSLSTQVPRESMTICYDASSSLWAYHPEWLYTEEIYTVASNLPSPNAMFPWVTATSGTGAANTLIATVNGDKLGRMQIATGTTPSGVCGIGTSNYAAYSTTVPAFRLGTHGQKTAIHYYIGGVGIPTLSTSAERFKFHVGMLNGVSSPTTLPSTCAMVTYDEQLNPNFITYVRGAGSSVDAYTTSVAVTAGVYYNIGISIQQTTASSQTTNFYIGVGTSNARNDATKNIFNASNLVRSVASTLTSANSLLPVIYMGKQVGATSRTASFDVIKVAIE